MNVFEKLDFSIHLAKKWKPVPGKKEGSILLRGNVGETKIKRARMLARRK